MSFLFDTMYFSSFWDDFNLFLSRKQTDDFFGLELCYFPCLTQIKNSWWDFARRRACAVPWRSATSAVLGVLGAARALSHLSVRGPSGQRGQGGQQAPAGISPGVQDRVWGVRALHVKQGRCWLPLGSWGDGRCCWKSTTGEPTQEIITLSRARFEQWAVNKSCGHKYTI